MAINEAEKAKIASDMEKLAELHPEEEYNEEVKTEEADDPVALEKARKKLMLMITVKCGGIGTDTIIGQLKPMVYKMSIKDCENMTEMIKKKGMYGLPVALKNRTKFIG